jgi:AP-1 complex subunit beta-1
MVVSNAVAALAEISETSETAQRVFQINTSTLQKMLAALNECTEWGQVFILDSLALYNPAAATEAESIIERVTPRLQHANSAVVLSAIKVMIKYMDLITSQDTLKALYKKMAPPLVTLLSSEPEIQYVALRNINLIVQKRPTILAHEIKVFFCKYNDPIYVKMEKLEIMIKLASERNVDQVLMELKEYSTEVDVEFVRRAVRAIGRCAIKLERAAERCINVLLELIQTKVNYVVQEAVIVIKDIFRKFPNRYESIIGTLCENLDTLDEPEAKASMIWIIGEYAERIDNADELLEGFLESFEEETPMVQLRCSPRRSSSSSSDPPTRRRWCRTSSPSPRRTATTPTFVTAATFTGACSPLTPRPPSRWFSPRSQTSPTTPSPSTRPCSTSSFRTSPPSPPSTTSRPRLSLAWAASPLPRWAAAATTATMKTTLTTRSPPI